MNPDIELILNKARRYCAYQERCVKEVEDKLKAWKVKPGQAEKVIRQLHEEKYLDNERFARVFASGRFRIKHWGRTRIKYELKAKGIPEEAIQSALEEITEEEYKEALHGLIHHKIKEVREQDPFLKKKKLLSFALQKGYEYDIIWEVLGSLNDETN